MSSASYWLQQGINLKRQGEFEEAILAYKKAMPLAHGDEVIEIYKAMAKSYFLLDDAVNALQHYTFAITSSIAMRIAVEKFSVDTDDEKMKIVLEYFDTLIHAGHAIISLSPQEALTSFTVWTLANTPNKKNSLDIKAFTKYVINELIDYKVRLSGGVFCYPDDFQLMNSPIPEPYNLNQLYIGFASTMIVQRVNWNLVNLSKMSTQI